MTDNIRNNFKPLQGDAADEPRQNPITLGEAMKQAIQRRNAQPQPAADLDAETLAALADMVVAKLRAELEPANFGEALKQAIQK